VLTTEGQIARRVTVANRMTSGIRISSAALMFVVAAMTVSRAQDLADVKSPRHEADGRAPAPRLADGHGFWQRKGAWASPSIDNLGGGKTPRGLGGANPESRGGSDASLGACSISARVTTTSPILKLLSGAGHPRYSSISSLFRSTDARTDPVLVRGSARFESCTWIAANIHRPTNGM
jgi:hypothetical protein